MSTDDESPMEGHEDHHKSRKQQRQEDEDARNHILLSSSEILCLTDDATAGEILCLTNDTADPAQCQSKNDSSKHKVQKNTPESRWSKQEEKTGKMLKELMTSHDTEATQSGSGPGAYPLDGSTTIVANEEPPVVVVASAIDRDALREEIRQELMANSVSANVASEIPTGQADDREERKCPQNWKVWAVLAVVLVIVVAVAARVVVLTQQSESEPPPPPPWMPPLPEESDP
eukprot:scaffold23796_cov181-Cylindrotheca_fusiformis.AAC.3